MHVLAYIPSPTRSVWHLGPIPVRAYALCIVLGIFVCLWLTARRMRERGGRSEDVWDVAGWAIVFGIVGGRLYHIVTDPELYFEGKPGTHPINALKIWDGGLGIWGAIALGALGAYIGCRRHGINFLVFADACAPGIVFAQAIGRWGNWFNNELYGGPTSLPWGLKINCIDVGIGHAIAGGTASGGEQCAPGAIALAQHFQPTFLYECLWDIAVGVAVIYLDRRLRLGRGNVFALYVMGYTLGRVWIEYLRTDHANHIFGVRLNVWTSIIVFLLALSWFLRHDGFRAVRETTPYTKARLAKQSGGTDAGADADAAGGPDVPSGADDATGRETEDEQEHEQPAAEHAEEPADVGTDD